MSYKTQSLVDLFPDVYAARERESLLYKLLDAFGAEMMTADDKIKNLLKSHWVRYAQADALDRLASIYGISRRNLSNGALESDTAFRLRLESTVPLFTGGGTVSAIKGAVRSALGLPFNLDQLKLPPEFNALRDEIDGLVSVEEFSPKADVVLASTVTTVALDARTNASQLIVPLTEGTASAKGAVPRIEWTFRVGAACRLSVTRLDTGTGFKSVEQFSVGAGQTIVFTAGLKGDLSAVINGLENKSSFTNLDGSTPALMPDIPNSPSNWQFRAQAALFDSAVFDRNSTFDLPVFHVNFSRVIYEPLTFEVVVPFFLKQAVENLRQRYNYLGDLFVFEGIPLDHIQEVVDQTRAAGVRGSVQFSLNFPEVHSPGEELRAEISGFFSEDAAASETFLAANTNDNQEDQEMRDRMVFGAVFDASTFDGPFGFV
jgi:hypothetical protein